MSAPALLTVRDELHAERTTLRDSIRALLDPAGVQRRVTARIAVARHEVSRARRWKKDAWLTIEEAADTFEAQGDRMMARRLRVLLERQI